MTNLIMNCVVQRAIRAMQLAMGHDLSWFLAVGSRRVEVLKQSKYPFLTKDHGEYSNVTFIYVYLDTVLKQNIEYQELQPQMAVAPLRTIVLRVKKENSIPHDILAIIQAIRIVLTFSQQHQTNKLLQYLIILKLEQTALTQRSVSMGEYKYKYIIHNNYDWTNQYQWVIEYWSNLSILLECRYFLMLRRKILIYLNCIRLLSDSILQYCENLVLRYP